MKIGVAIPCYIGHIKHLFELLDSIESQTSLPNKVIVSSSSTKEIQIDKKYSFPLEVICNIEKKNASQNRNIAASKLLDMNYITFIDADDIMHPRRIEALLFAINNCNSDIILHNYSMVPFCEKIDSFQVRTHTLIQAPSGCITQISGYSDREDKIHHSQVTVKREIFEKVQFPEDIRFNRREDSVFCYNVFSLPNINHAYIQNELSYYRPSNTPF